MNDKEPSSIVEIKQRYNLLSLTWVINNICTNQCVYCPPNLHNGTNHNYEWSHAERLAKHLIDRYPKINLAISGGEPTLSPFLNDLVKMFSDKGHSVGMTTNGARTVRYYEDISQYMTYIVFSHHPSFADPLLVEKAVTASKNSIVTISVMFDSRHFDQCLDFCESLRDKYPTVAVQPVRIHDWNVGNTLGRDYTEEQIEILTNFKRLNAKSIAKPKNPFLRDTYAVHENGNTSKFDAQELINNHETNFLGWECDIGLESFYVKFDGIIRTGNCISSKVIGKIQEFDNIEWPTTSFTCPQTFCHCTTDVYISKRKKI